MGSRALRSLSLSIVALAAAVMLAPPLRAAPAAGVPRLTHTVVIVFENHERSDILGSSAAPTFQHLASTYAQATADYAVGHPSLPNYLALVSGSTHGVTSDCTDCPQSGQTIGSQLSAKHLPWAAYQGLPELQPIREEARPVSLLSRHRFACLPPPTLQPSQTSVLLACRPRPLQRHARLLRSRPATTGSTSSSLRSSPSKTPRSSSSSTKEQATPAAAATSLSSLPAPLCDGTRCSRPRPRTTVCFAQSNPRSDCPSSDTPVHNPAHGHLAMTTHQRRGRNCTEHDPRTCVSLFGVERQA